MLLCRWAGAAPLVLLLVVTAVVTANDGDRQLLQAFNAAFVRYLLHDTSLPVIRPLDCPVDAAVYPFPEPKKGAALDTVLRRESLNCGRPLLLDPSDDFDGIVRIIGTYYHEHDPEHYGSNLTVTWYKYSSTGDMWDALSNGDIDCARKAARRRRPAHSLQALLTSN
eukprot:TRINITY_DN342_c0_g1_i1.p1 TRINITY_DN342_c0_g1~~TRINITY_DN342_c0_g1_i1.p1  ORF type:complete len:167 (-),score=35.00 TRINITY_DN342_c0_g1_i1:463-963(-)